MRDEIIKQLPPNLPKDKVVLVVGPENYNGLSGLKSQISEMSNGDKWIRGEFRTTVSESQISDKVAVLLTMVGVGHGTLANMRRAASQHNICCPNQALTVGEVKKILAQLKRIREAESHIPKPNGSGNGNKTLHSLPGAGEAQRISHIKKIAERSTQEFGSVAHLEPTLLESAEEKSETPSLHNQSDIDSALATLQNIGISFNSIMEEAQLAVMVVGDELTRIKTRYTDLELQLEVKEGEITKLREDLEAASNKAASESSTIQRENERLKAENLRLQNTLRNLGDLISGAQK